MNVHCRGEKPIISTNPTHKIWFEKKSWRDRNHLTLVQDNWWLKDRRCVQSSLKYILLSFRLLDFVEHRHRHCVVQTGRGAAMAEIRRAQMRAEHRAEVTHQVDHLPCTIVVNTLKAIGHDRQLDTMVGIVERSRSEARQCRIYQLLFCSSQSQLQLPSRGTWGMQNFSNRLDVFVRGCRECLRRTSSRHPWAKSSRKLQTASFFMFH